MSPQKDLNIRIVSQNLGSNEAENIDSKISQQDERNSAVVPEKLMNISSLQFTNGSVCMERQRDAERC